MFSIYKNTQQENQTKDTMHDKPKPLQKIQNQMITEEIKNPFKNKKLQPQTHHITMKKQKNKSNIPSTLQANKTFVPSIFQANEAFAPSILQTNVTFVPSIFQANETILPSKPHTNENTEPSKPQKNEGFDEIFNQFGDFECDCNDCSYIYDVEL